MNAKENLQKLKDILRRPRYLLFSISLSIISLIAYSIFSNAGLLERYILEGDLSLALALAPGISLRYFQTLPKIEILLIIVISGLIGINITLAAFRLLELSEFGRENASSITGAFIATFAPACTACAGAVVGLTGTSSIVAMIPFSGYSIRILAIIFLLASTIYTLNQLGRKACKI